MRHRPDNATFKCRKPTKNKSKDRIMITINGEPLPQEAIDFEYRRIRQYYANHMPPEQLKTHDEKLRNQAVEQAIGAKLLLNEAGRLDILVPEDLIDRKVQPIIEQTGGKDVFLQRLQDNGISEKEFRANIAEGCKVDLLIEHICEGLSDPSEEEMKAFFENNKEHYQQPERVNASHILIRPDSDRDDDRVVAESRLESIAQEIRDGKDFGELAAQHSQCPSGKQNGGSLGWFSRGMMVPEFEEAAFSMAVGEISEIIETQFGFHIIMKTAEDEGGQAAFDEARDKIRDVIRHDQRGKCVAAYVADLKGKAEIHDTSA
ncbi:MAG: peptidylprolyl isomerase [Kiritimatiellia bacterium]